MGVAKEILLFANKFGSNCFLMTQAFLKAGVQRNKLFPTDLL